MAYRDGLLSDRVNVCIDARQAFDFISAVENDSRYNHEIALESMLNNGRYPNLELRLCDLETTDFDIRNCKSYIHNCIHVTVKFVEHIPRTRITFALSRFRFRQYRQAISKAPSISKTNESAALFKSMIRAASANSDKVWLNGKQLNASLFRKATKVCIENHSFEVPGRGEDYLTLEFGKLWRNHDCYEYRESSENFVSCNTAWTEYAKVFEDIDFDLYLKTRQEDRIINEKFKKEHAKIVKCYDILERTFDRIYLFQQYSPKKEYLMELSREGKVDELRSELQEYIDFIMKHYARGLGICFDKDILELALQILQKDMGDKFVESVRELIPEQHLKPIQLKDYKGNYI